MHTISMISANLRYPCTSDPWPFFDQRLEAIVDLFQSRNVDIIAMQEARADMLRALEIRLPDYVFVARARDYDEEDEAPAIAYLNRRFSLVESETAWLSPTPEIAGSRYPGQSICPRTYQLLRLRFRGEELSFRILNTHLDHESETARLAAAQQILARLSGLESADPKRRPLLVSGDFNAEPSEACVQAIIDANSSLGLQLFDSTPQLDYSYHEYHLDPNWSPKRIDYIFHSRELQPVSFRSHEKSGSIYLSDHRFLELTFEIV
ncbi:MAG: endonuclease/exonuclease/phosphatase family protein [Eubacteriales bacterium]|nr:endonuclease/exonuclease/phosphatase family protein [Eubacteriales bacterium]